MSFSGKTQIVLKLLEQSTSNTIGLVNEAIPSDANKPPVMTWTDGTGDNQAAKVWSTRQTLSTGTTFDLTNLTGARGAVSFATIKGFFVINYSTSATIAIGNATSNGWAGPLSSQTTTETIPAGGQTLRERPIGGWTVDSTHKALLVTPSASCEFGLVVWGT